MSSAIPVAAAAVKAHSGDACRNGFDMIQSQPLRSSSSSIISFTFSSLMLKSSDSERLDKFSEVLVEF